MLQACRTGDLAAAARLVRDNPWIVAAPTAASGGGEGDGEAAAGPLPLIVACERGHAHLAQHLLHAHAVHMIACPAAEAVGAAVAGGHAALAAWLDEQLYGLAEGDDPDPALLAGALDRAFTAGHTAVAKWAVKRYGMARNARVGASAVFTLQRCCLVQWESVPAIIDCFAGAIRRSPVFAVAVALESIVSAGRDAVERMRYVSMRLALPIVYEIYVCALARAAERGDIATLTYILCLLQKRVDERCTEWSYFLAQQPDVQACFVRHMRLTETHMRAAFGDGRPLPDHIRHALDREGELEDAYAFQ